MMQQYRDAKARHPGMLAAVPHAATSTRLFEEDAELGCPRPRPDADQPRQARSRWPASRHQARALPRASCSTPATASPSASRWRTPALAKGIVHREVTRVVTPGTVTEDELLDPRPANHLVAVVPGKRRRVRPGLGRALDRRRSAPPTCRATRLADELAPAERRPSAWSPRAAAAAVDRRLPARTCRGAADRPARTGRSTRRPRRGALRTHFRVATLAGFGFDDDQPCLAAAGALVLYLQETLEGEPGPPPPAAAVPRRTRS